MSSVRSEHTPGPWEALHFRRGISVKAGSVPVASVAAANIAAIADARLIAAAPDLLDALKRAEGHLADEIHNRHIHPIGHCPVLDWVRAAIAKAEGRK